MITQSSWDSVPPAREIQPVSVGKDGSLGPMAACVSESRGVSIGQRRCSSVYKNQDLTASSPFLHTPTTLYPKPNFNNGLHCLHFHRLRRGPQDVQGPGACRRSKSVSDSATMRVFRKHPICGVDITVRESPSASPGGLRRRFIRLEEVNLSDGTSSRRIRAFGAVRGAHAWRRARTRVGFVRENCPSRRYRSFLPDRI